MTPNDLRTMFSFATTPEERLDMLIDLSKTHVSPSEKFTDDECVQGCASYVALRIHDGKLETTTDSIILKGFLKVFEIVYNENPETDLIAFLKELKIDNVLSTQRQNGLINILKKIKLEEQ